MRSRLNWFSILTAVLMLVLVMTGAAVTSSHDQPRMSWLLSVHRTVAIAVAVFTIGLLLAISRQMMRFACVVLAALLLEIFLPKASTFHAVLSALLFAAVSTIALVSSPSWQRDPDLVLDYGWPSLKSLSALAAVLVGMQVGFGAGIRHSAVGVMPHLVGALIVAIFIIIVGVFATNQFPKHAVLRPLATALMVITGVQVFLGMTVFLMRMMNVSATTAWLWISVAHVATGNMTFAASVWLAIEIRRNVRKREAQ